MTRIVNKIKLLLSYLGSVFPTAIPIGMTNFKAWSDSIVAMSGLPDNDSVRFGLAATVLHLGPTAAYKPKLYFVLVLRAGAAKQIAGAVFTEIKENQMKLAASTEATVQPIRAVADGQTQ